MFSSAPKLSQGAQFRKEVREAKEMRSKLLDFMALYQSQISASKQSKDASYKALYESNAAATRQQLKDLLNNIVNKMSSLSDQAPLLPKPDPRPVITQEMRAKRKELLDLTLKGYRHPRGYLNKADYTRAENLVQNIDELGFRPREPKCSPRLQLIKGKCIAGHRPYIAVSNVDKKPYICCKKRRVVHKKKSTH